MIDPATSPYRPAMTSSVVTPIAPGSRRSAIATPGNHSFWMSAIRKTTKAITATVGLRPMTAMAVPAASSITTHPGSPSSAANLRTDNSDVIVSMTAKPMDHTTPNRPTQIDRARANMPATVPDPASPPRIRRRMRPVPKKEARTRATEQG